MTFTRTLLIALAALVFVAPASASQLIDRGATGVSLKVNAKGQAMVEYTAGGKPHHVLAWGAVNALQPKAGVPQVKFKVDYSGGWGTYGHTVYKGFPDTCKPYHGPKLAWYVTGCTASDGSFWALQAWQLELPNLGFAPWLPNQKMPRLMLSHWTGPVAQFEAYTNWVWGGRFHGLFGRLTYKGVPVHGFSSTSQGQVLDSYGRNMYLDTYNSAYGSGWHRENGFLAHNPNGNFCYGFYEHNPLTGGYSAPPGYHAGMRPMGNGSRYRLSVNGPGVTPDVTWEGAGLPNWDATNPALVALQDKMNVLWDKLAAGDKTCRRH